MQKSTCLLIAISFVTFLGCSKGSNLVPATGSITVNGKPAVGAVLLFHPEAAGANVSSAVAKEDGSFAPVTDAEPGIPVGRYKVTITWPDPSVKPTERQLMMGNFEPGPDLLKGKYVQKNTTPLSTEITSTTKAIPSFELATK